MQDVEKLLQEAEAGNAEAMVELCRYYITENDQGKAEEWADKAADAGSGEGYWLSLRCHSLGLIAAQHLGFWTLLKNESDIVLGRAYTLKRAHADGVISLTGDHLKTIDDAVDEAFYSKAVAEYCLDEDNQKCSEIAEMLDGIQTTKAYVLKALCLMNTESYAEAFQLMVKVFRDESYAAKEKETIEEGTFAQVMHDMAVIYRVGLPGVVGQNLTEAVNVLRYALHYVKDEDFRAMLKKELGRYQKKLFGGYKYV